MKELKFTPENLQRHLRARPRIITTTRASYKGGIGTIFYIDGAGYFVVKYVKHYRAMYLDSLTTDYWKEEGFASSGEFFRELKKLYPNADDFYLYELEEVFLD